VTGYPVEYWSGWFFTIVALLMDIVQFSTKLKWLSILCRAARFPEFSWTWIFFVYNVHFIVPFHWKAVHFLGING
jgi:hypothetical protein